MTDTDTAKVRLVVEPEPEPDLSWLDQECFADEDKADHVVYWVRVERECPACGEWSTVDSLGNVDMLAAWGDLAGTYSTREELIGRNGPEASYLWDCVQVEPEPPASLSLRYGVTATIVTERDGWSGMRQVPYFELNGNVQGSLTTEHAEQIARDIIDPLGTYAEVHVSVVLL